ncbi:Rz1-like lysis system protein LysC [Salmonella enterica subsp. houtenae]
MILSACTSTPPLPAVRLTAACPKLTPCQLSALQPQTNEDLSRALLETENAWHQCAALVDMTISCQERINAQSAAHP